MLDRLRPTDNGEVVDAQLMGEWLPDYLYAILDEPGEIVPTAAERLRRQFGPGSPVVHIETVRDAMLAFDGPHQVNLFSYFCGYPQHALDMMADEEVTMEETIALLDTLYPPHKNEEKVRPVAKKIVATTVHIQGESLAEVSPGVASSTDYPLSWRFGTAASTDPDHLLAWQGDALCAQTDPEAFFPEKGGSTRDAKRLCASCDVREQCLDYALDNDERFGIWGGHSERERRKIKKYEMTAQEAIAMFDENVRSKAV